MKKIFIIIGLIVSLFGYSQQNSGTLVTSAIRPNDAQDDIASVFANEVKGGVHNVTHYTELADIKSSRLQNGMLATVSDSSGVLFQYNDGEWIRFNLQSIYEIDPQWILDSSLYATKYYISEVIHDSLISSESYNETDPIFLEWDKSSGISITESQISDFGTYDNYNAWKIALYGEDEYTVSSGETITVNDGEQIEWLYDNSTKTLRADFTGTIPSGNTIIDWTQASQGTIHATNYVDNDTQLSDSEISDFGYIKDGNTNWDNNYNFITNATASITSSQVTDFDDAVSDNTDVSFNTNFRTQPWNYINAGTSLEWDNNTLNYTGAGQVENIVSGNSVNVSENTGVFTVGVSDAGITSTQMASNSVSSANIINNTINEEDLNTTNSPINGYSVVATGTGSFKYVDISGVGSEGVNSISVNYPLIDNGTLTDPQLSIAENGITTTELNVGSAGTIGYGLISDGDGSLSWVSLVKNINDLNDVSTGGASVGQVLKFDSNGDLVPADDETGINDVTGLELITESSNSGWRLIGRNPAYYGDIGNGAVDLSNSISSSTTRGATGIGSFAVGSSTTASGIYSFISGYNSTAEGNYSAAFGYNNTVTGAAAFSAGRDNTSSSDYSFAEGKGTTASGTGSHSEGYETEASGDYSHSEGRSTIAAGDYSHTGGGTATVGAYVVASGDYSFNHQYTGNAGNYDAAGAACAILGGSSQFVDTLSGNSGIFCGSLNVIGQSAQSSVIIGGQGNSIADGAEGVSIISGHGITNADQDYTLYVNNIIVDESIFIDGAFYVNTGDSPPSSSTDSGTPGEIRVTTTYIYVCVATNTWKRIALSSW